MGNCIKSFYKRILKLICLSLGLNFCFSSSYAITSGQIAQIVTSVSKIPFAVLSDHFENKNEK